MSHPIESVGYRFHNAAIAVNASDPASTDQRLNLVRPDERASVQRHGSEWLGELWRASGLVSRSEGGLYSLCWRESGAA